MLNIVLQLHVALKKAFAYVTDYEKKICFLL